jgi:ABC-type multidrug transport system fused ATPase/permease subunit
VRLWVCVAAGGLAQLSDLPLALLIGRLTDRAVSSAWPVGPGLAVPWELWSLGVLVAARFGAQWVQIAVGESLAQGTLAEVRLRMFAHLHRLPLRRLSRRDPGRTAVRFAGDAASLRTWIARTLVEVPADVLMLIGILIGLSAIEPRLAGAAALPLALSIPVVLRADPRVRVLTRRARSEQAVVTGDVVRTLTDAASLRRAGLVPRARRSASARLRRVRGLLIARGRAEATLRAAVEVAASAALVGVASLGAWLLSLGVLTAGDLVSATWLAALLGGPLRRMASASVIHGRARVARERIESLLSQAVEGGGGVRRVDGPVRLRLRGLVLPLAGGGATRPIDGTLRGPGVFQVVGPRRACEALAGVLLREIGPVSGRVGLNGLRLSRYSRPALRRAVWRVDAEGYAALASGAAEVSGLDPIALAPEARMRAGIAAGLARRALVLVIDVPEDLDGSAKAALSVWLADRSDRALVLLLGGAGFEGVGRVDLEQAAAGPGGSGERGGGEGVVGHAVPSAVLG